MHMMFTRRRRTGRVAVCAAAALALAACGGPTEEPPRPTPTRTTPAPEPPPPPPPDPATAVKIDNVRQARPQTGLSLADIVYVEPVEYGLTRLLAVYSTEVPDAIGPVRSARITDIEILAQFGEPVFAYSGAAPHVLDALNEAPIISATEAGARGAFYREPSRGAPHNLYLRPAQLPPPGQAPEAPVMVTGPGPEDGAPAAEYRAQYETATYDFTWSEENQQWMISVDGALMETTDAGQASTPNVVIQEVDVRIEAAGSPVAATVGEGAVTVLRDGLRHEGRWTRPSPSEPTRYVSYEGEELPVGEGAVWVLLVPAQ
ncbi:DUF3048 domain-containing protein [Hoyosella subflava]|uniref:DUF3048 domain-containing protein n=1 Tax=Hoyosella subflava (strain DSM 45089 / JCM 17490 / NBRC 109087 / DQS3-9A1) TaxID=443218 RepID=F6EFK1_HOYSD|nr:DUF3048 domain-containing protein [Hoyosella subflava]AEF40930.1 hypothetical protein AS9A_2483 [Hoyosella subflava DQS3-9A1]